MISLEELDKVINKDTATKTVSVDSLGVYDRVNIIEHMSISILSMYKKVYTNYINLAPDYQRQFVWSYKQQQRYIEALFLNKARVTPVFICNWENDEGFYEVLDGKQRLLTICNFLNDNIEIFGGLTFSQLNRLDKEKFVNTNVIYTRIEPTNKCNLSVQDKVYLFILLNNLNGTKISDTSLRKLEGEFINGTRN